MPPLDQMVFVKFGGEGQSSANEPAAQRTDTPLRSMTTSNTNNAAYRQLKLIYFFYYTVSTLSTNKHHNFTASTLHSRPPTQLGTSWTPR